MKNGAVRAVRVIVTRPRRDAERWALRLRREAGADTEVFPLIEIAPLASAALPHAVRDYAACLFVSAHAVEHFFENNTDLAQEARAQAAINTIAGDPFGLNAPALRFMAPGPGTAAALRAEGIAANRIDTPPADAIQFDSEALWQVVGQRDWQGRRVLIARGQSAGAHADSPGRDWIARRWREAGASVDFAVVYQRRAPTLTQAQVERARAGATDGSVWLFSSSEAVGNLIGQAALAGIDWSRARALATHPRIAQAARAAGWGVVAESRPSLADIGTALGSIELGDP